jgi:hypothetical protein
MEDGSDSAALNRDWPAAVVAAVIIIVLGVVVYKAIDKYDANEVLNIWTGLTGILGGVIGATGSGGLGAVAGTGPDGSHGGERSGGSLEEGAYHVMAKR